MTAVDVAGALPEISVLRDRCRAMAVLDAILSPEWESRYFSFDAGWGPGQEMASMRDGSGDAYSIVFSGAGAFIRGFAHESSMSPAANEGELWPGLVDTVPEVFAGCVNEPAFSDDDTLAATVCLWREAGDDRWHVGDVEFPDGADPDGADSLFAALLEGTGDAYRRFAEDYYELPVDGGAVSSIYALEPVSDEVVRRLNPDVSVQDLADDLAEIGYPSRESG